MGSRRTSRRPVVVIAKKVGRLANRLVLFAHFIGAALEHDFVVVNPSFGHPYAAYFPTIARDLLCRFPPGRRLPAPWHARRLFYDATKAAADGLFALQRHGRDVGLVRLRRDQRLDLNSEGFLGVVRRHRVVFVQDWFFRNAANCARHRESILSFFTPWSYHVARAHAAVERARRDGSLLVGVHVRRGDYAHFKDGAFFYSHAHYRRVMEAVQAAFPDEDVSFFVCSDEPVPADVFSGLPVSRGTGQQLEDLYALGECDRLVGPPSTYTGWASFYGGAPLYHLRGPDAMPTPDSFRPGGGAAWGP